MLIVIFMLVFATYFDVRTGKIPNLLIIISMVVGIAIQFYFLHYWGVLQCIMASMVPLVILYPIFKIGALGAGDIKLLMAIGCYMHLSDVLLCIFFSFIIAVIPCLIKMNKEHNFSERMEYFTLYIQNIIQSGKILCYESMEQTCQRSQHQICFSIPILISVLLHLGGVY